MVSNWFIDFDDTLVSGSATWGIEHAFPKLVQEHHLRYDYDAFQKAIFVAYERGNQSTDAETILKELFDTIMDKAK
jgi:hypothetical protein